jgi:hypothetical protein
MLALLLLEVNWICVLLRLVSTQLDRIIEERVLPEGYAPALPQGRFFLNYTSTTFHSVPFLIKRPSTRCT